MTVQRARLVFLVGGRLLVVIILVILRGRGSLIVGVILIIPLVGITTTLVILTRVALALVPVLGLELLIWGPLVSILILETLRGRVANLETNLASRLALLIAYLIVGALLRKFLSAFIFIMALEATEIACNVALAVP